MQLGPLVGLKPSGLSLWLGSAFLYTAALFPIRCIFCAFQPQDRWKIFTPKFPSLHLCHPRGWPEMSGCLNYFGLCAANLHHSPFWFLSQLINNHSKMIGECDWDQNDVSYNFPLNCTHLVTSSLSSSGISPSQEQAWPGELVIR